MSDVPDDFLNYESDGVYHSLNPSQKQQPVPQQSSLTPSRRNFRGPQRMSKLQSNAKQPTLQAAQKNIVTTESEIEGEVASRYSSNVQVTDGDENFIPQQSSLSPSRRKKEPAAKSAGIIEKLQSSHHQSMPSYSSNVQVTDDNENFAPQLSSSLTPSRRKEKPAQKVEILDKVQINQHQRVRSISSNISGTDGNENYLSTTNNEPEASAIRSCSNCGEILTIQGVTCTKCNSIGNKHRRQPTGTILATVIEQRETHLVTQESMPEQNLIPSESGRSIGSELELGSMQDTGTEKFSSPTLVKKKSGILHMCQFDACEFAAIDVCCYQVWMKRGGCDRMFCVRHNGKGSTRQCQGGLCQDCTFQAQSAYIVTVLAVAMMAIGVVSLPMAYYCVF